MSVKDNARKKMIQEHSAYISKRASLIAYKNYTQLFPFFVGVLRKTRIPFLKKNRFWIGILQLSMLRNISKFQEELRVLGNKLKDDSIDKKEREDLQHKQMIYQEWLRIYQTIVDGIVWRVLNFNRPILRLLSEGESMGHILPSYAEILKKFVSSRDTVLINDLSRYLRIGDLTHVTKDGRIFLYELKKSGKSIIGVSDIFREIKKHGVNSISRQRHRQLIAQMSIVNQAISIFHISGDKIKEEHLADIVSVDFPISHHFLALKSLIKKANKSGVESAELEEGYFVEVTAFDILMSGIKESEDAKSHPLMIRKKQSILERPDWCRDKEIKTINLSSFESFVREGTQFPRNLTPQSVLLLSSKDCVRLMMGSLEITVFLNLDFLKKKLEQSGWKVDYVVQPLSQSKEKKDTQGEFMPKIPSEDFLNISKSDKNGTYYAVIPLTLILLALSSYYKIDFILRAITDGFERDRGQQRGKRNIAMNFIREKEILI